MIHLAPDGQIIELVGLPSASKMNLNHALKNLIEISPRQALLVRLTTLSPTFIDRDFLWLGAAQQLFAHYEIDFVDFLKISSKRTLSLTDVELFERLHTENQQEHTVLETNGAKKFYELYENYEEEDSCCDCLNFSLPT